MLDYGNKVYDMGAHVHIPGLDFLWGISHGRRCYEDYYENNLTNLKKCDALYITPQSEESKGVRAEVNFANSIGIPVFDNHWELFEFINRPKIMCIVGNSGSGKSLMADYIEEEFDIQMIRSYTTRDKRDKDDLGHTFVTKEEFSKFNKKDMVAYTNFGGNEYCCLHEDIEKRNTYVIDEAGYSMLRHKYKHLYNICGVRVWCDDDVIKGRIGTERMLRDKERFRFYPTDFDYNITNNSIIEEFYDKIDEVVGEFFD